MFSVEFCRTAFSRNLRRTLHVMFMPASFPLKYSILSSNGLVYLILFFKF